MDILILSDLHIDTNDNLGIFQWDEMEFIMQIERIRDTYSIDKVIFNGDIFELVKYSFEDVRKANPAMMRYFQNKDFIFIRGNHDLANKSALDYYQITNPQGQVIHIEHGHKADWLNGNKMGRLIGRIGFSLLKKMSNHKWLMDLYFKVEALNNQINHIPKRYNTIKYLAYALKLLKEYDVVILGHTHKLESHHTYYLNRKKRYLNCGSCSLGRFQSVVLDTETLRYELIKESKESIKISKVFKYAS